MVKKNKKINVAAKALEIFDDITDNGFNEIQIEYSEKESIWHEEYALFIIEFDTYSYSDYDSYDYPSYVTPPQFDETKFRKDFVEYLEKEFPQCRINFSEGGSEFEICGPNYKSFYRKYENEIESLSNISRHSIFIHDAKPAKSSRKIKK